MRRWLLVFLVACSSVNQSSKAPTMAPMAPTEPAGTGDPHARIEQLSKLIDDQMQSFGNPSAMHPMAASAAVPAAPFSTTDTQCHPAKTDTCDDTCKLSDSICGNAKKICDLAKDLAGDTWAEGKCTDANKSCDSAHAKCCGCAS